MTSEVPSRRRRNGPTSGFASRLLIAQALVLVTGAVTAWFVASAVAPRLFHEHLARAGANHSPTETEHVEEAFGSALLISLLVALVLAFSIALAVTWFFTRRVQRSAAAVADAAAAVASGNYSARIPRSRLGSEFDQLTHAFNALAQRLEDVEATRRRMLADLGHEMRTPLATLDAHLDAVEDGVRVLDSSTLSVLRSSTRRLGRLAEDLNAVSRALEGDTVTKTVRSSAERIVGHATDLATNGYRAKNVRLDVDLQPTSAVLVDEERLGQVLANLLDNALRHTPPGGQVTIAAREAGPRVLISVTDTGQGIAAEHLDHIFDRFYRVDPARHHDHEGSGIGLTISRRLIEAHAGTLSVHSAGAGCGAAFTIDLPAASDPGPSGPDRTRSTRRTRASRRS